MMRELATIALTVLLAMSLTGCETAAQREAERQRRADALLIDAEEFLTRDLSDSALAAFGMALEENPRLTEAHMGMGDIYLDRGNYELAEPAYERATEVEPDNYEAHYYLGLVRQLRGRVEDAIRTYLRALALNPESMEANRDLAAAYLQLGRAGEAVPYARQAVRLDPESQAAWSNLGAAYSLTRRYDRALDAYRHAVELGEREQPVLLGLADAHIQLGNHQQAVNVLQALLRDNPDSGTGHERMGLAQFRMREFETALTHYERASELDESDTAALNGVGVCLMTLYLQEERGDEDLRERAVEAWRQSLRLRPDQPRISDLLARFGRY
ncbi:MAG: tetratricopeptide repeat protein [Phycisphaeraceae bacterium]